MFAMAAGSEEIVGFLFQLCREGLEGKGEILKNRRLKI
jgi:hypothetical protein